MHCHAYKSLRTCHPITFPGFLQTTVLQVDTPEYMYFTCINTPYINPCYSMGHSMIRSQSTTFPIYHYYIWHVADHPLSMYITSIHRFPCKLGFMSFLYTNNHIGYVLE